MLLSAPERGHLGDHGSSELRRQYLAYRTRQARALAQLLPRDAIRPLYRRARELADDDGFGQEDPMTVLVEYCEQILPLPPFDVWLQDATLHPAAHLLDLDESADVPTAHAPVTMEARQFEYDDRPWVAHLRSFRDGPTWRAFIAFEERRSGRVHRTAVVFCEDDPTHLRERFLSFETASLEAFLRSSLP